MSQALKFAAGTAVAAPLFVDDLFVSYVRTGTAAEATITTNIDMTEGYTLWSKGCSGATDHAVYDSARGVTLDLVTNSTAAQTTQAEGLKSVSTTGHTIGTLAKMNTSAATYVDWVFRFAPNFHSAQVVVKSSGSNQTALFPELTTLGMVRVKRTDVAGSWYIWHRSLTAGKLLIGETTAAEATLGHITVSGTTVTLVNGVIADGTYLVEAWAHDTSAEGIIQCGTFTTDASGNATVNLGWEVQYVVFKQNAVINWRQLDTSRGWSMSEDNFLYSNTSGSEVASSSWGSPTATGFTLGSGGNAQTYFYLTIRRPNKPPTLGTQVYNAIARTGTGAAATVTGVGFAPDMMLLNNRALSARNMFDRLRGAKQRLYTSNTNAESTIALDTYFTMDGLFTADDGSGGINTSGASYINHLFRRAPGFFDIVCDTGTGAAHTVAHNLTVVPELIIRKCRSASALWLVYDAASGAGYYSVLNATNVKAANTAAWNNTAPTATVFSLGNSWVELNQASATYVTYLFATIPGLSKIGSYTGNGTTQNIEMGFTTGARFFLVKADSTTGSWWIFDVVRGIVAGTDFGLQLNSTAAETTSADAVDPYAGGISVVQEATCSINANGINYLYLGIA